MSKEKNIPKIRFPGFDGEWEQKKIDYLISELKSGLSRELRDEDINMTYLIGIFKFIMVKSMQEFA